MKNFMTSDIHLAAFLLVKKAVFEGISKKESKCYFAFEDIENCQKLEIDFTNNGECSARELFNRRSELMSQVRNLT